MLDEHCHGRKTIFVYFAAKRAEYRSVNRPDRRHRQTVALMRKVLEYQNLAKSWRRRAADASKDTDKDALLRLAATWDMLAAMRQTQIEKGLIEPIRR